MDPVTIADAEPLDETLPLKLELRAASFFPELILVL